MSRDTNQLTKTAMVAEVLTPEAEYAVAVAWRDHGDVEALQRLITAYLRLAISMAHKSKSRSVPISDLIQEASVGLMRAAEKFDPDRGVRFSTYAIFWIKASIQELVMRDHSLVKIGTSASQKQLFFKLGLIRSKFEKEAQKNGETLTRTQECELIADYLGLSVKNVESTYGRLSGPDFSLNAPTGDEEGSQTWIDRIEDGLAEGAASVELLHDTEFLKQQVRSALSDLTEREQFIVRQRHLRSDPQILRDVAKKLGLSAERVRQIEQRAFEKMRLHFGQNPEIEALLF